jgi:deoxyribose-phosphate aldolase
MQLELNLLDQTKSEKDIITKFFTGTGNGINTVFVAPYYAGKLKALLGTVKIACPVDFPDGLGDAVLRHGANYIDLLINPIHLVNGRKEELTQDIKAIKNICDDKDVELRAVVDYRMYTDGLVLSLCSILRQLGVVYIIPSSGQFVDDVTDNIIFCQLISNKNPGVKTILNTSFCTKEQFDKIPKDIYGLRLKSYNFGV